MLRLRNIGKAGGLCVKRAVELSLASQAVSTSMSKVRVSRSAMRRPLAPEKRSKDKAVDETDRLITRGVIDRI